MRSDFDDNPDEREVEQLKQKRNEACDERDRARAERDHAVKWAEEEGERAGELAGQLLDTEAERDQLQERVEQAEYTAVESAKLAAQVSAERDQLQECLLRSETLWQERIAILKAEIEELKHERDSWADTAAMLLEKGKNPRNKHEGSAHIPC